MRKSRRNQCSPGISALDRVRYPSESVVRWNFNDSRRTARKGNISRPQTITEASEKDCAPNEQSPAALQ